MNQIKFNQLSALASILSFIQNKFVEQLGSLYGMLMTTFDPDEIPLLQFLETTGRDPTGGVFRARIIEFAVLEKLLKTALLFSDITSGQNKYDMVCLFNHYYDAYFSFVVETDECPITFKTFKTWFELFKQGNDDMMSIIPAKHPMQVYFAKSNKSINLLVANVFK
jgi:hypothetical protein